MKNIAVLCLAAGIGSLATAKELPPLPTFAPMPHLEVVETYEGNGISLIDISVRNRAGKVCSSVNVSVELALKGRSEGGAFLNPATNIVQVSKGRARVRMRRPSQTDRSVTRLSCKPVAAKILPASIVLADFDDVKAVWVRHREGGVPYEVPASSVTNSFKVTIRCERPFHLYSDPVKPMAFDISYRNLTAAPRKVKAHYTVWDWDGKVVAKKVAEAKVAPEVRKWRQKPRKWLKRT